MLCFLLYQRDKCSFLFLFPVLDTGSHQPADLATSQGEADLLHYPPSNMHIIMLTKRLILERSCTNCRLCKTSTSRSEYLGTRIKRPTQHQDTITSYLSTFKYFFVLVVLLTFCSLGESKSTFSAVATAFLSRQLLYIYNVHICTVGLHHIDLLVYFDCK